MLKRILLLCLLVLVPSFALADPITVNFSGIVTTLDIRPTIGFDVGGPITGYFTYLPGGNNCTNTICALTSPSTFSMTIGGLTFAGPGSMTIYADTQFEVLRIDTTTELAHVGIFLTPSLNQNGWDVPLVGCESVWNCPASAWILPDNMDNWIANVQVRDVGQPLDWEVTQISPNNDFYLSRDRVTLATVTTVQNPEPSSWILLLSGLVGVGWQVRRRTKGNAAVDVPVSRG